MELSAMLCRRAALCRDARFDGRFFVAVKTTGIYCRPICPVKPPKSENCVYFGSAAAAQVAGFRACLRCRPECAPAWAASKGTQTTVTRALALIESGALETESLAGLAERLGIGGRHLRRLFLRHLGATPIAVAQVHRLLLAKQLIHETQLSMVAVAMSSGYGSVRRLNESFQKSFHRAPLSLRAKRAHSRNNLHNLEIGLSYRHPYHWQSMLAFLSARAVAGVEGVRDNVYFRSFEDQGTTGYLRVVNDAAANRLQVRFTFLGAPGSAVESSFKALRGLIAKVKRMFDVEVDAAAVDEHLSWDERLAHLVALRPGLRVPGAWDNFELGVRAIVGQQITVRAATGYLSQMALAHGVALEISEGYGQVSRLFPTPVKLSNMTLTGMPRARAETISRFAQDCILRGEPERKTSLEHSLGSLRTVKGIGDWTAQYISMRGLGEPDAFPAGDVVLQKAMAMNGRRPTPKQLLVYAEHWRPFRAYAAMHLWTEQANARP